MGQISHCYTANQLAAGAATALNILKDSLLHFYAPVVQMIEQLIEDKKILPGYNSASIQKICREYNKADFLPEEKRLSFLADVKEATVMGEKCLKYITSQEKYMFTVVCRLARFCIQEDYGHIDFERLKSECGNTNDGPIFYHICYLMM